MVCPPWLTDSPELRGQLVRYYDAVSTLDAQVGRRLAWLEEQGVAENTIVIFISDHGRGLSREKRWCYDAGLHLPLIVRWPGHLPAGEFCDELVGWVDLAPTLLALAGARVPEDYQGQIFLGPEKAAPREACFAGRDRMDEVFDRVRAVRTREWHYIRNFAPQLPWAQCQTYMEQQEIMGVMREQARHGTLCGGATTFFQPEKPVEELYDAVRDPDCMHNLAAKPECAGILHQMRDRLRRHLLEVDDLGAVSEEELVERGVVTNRLPEYRERMRPLPAGQQMTPFPFPMTLWEAESL